MQMNHKNVARILRIAIFLTFFGHGIVATQGNSQWIEYLKFIGFSSELATRMLTFIGVLDILVAFSILIKPNKYILLWASLWAFSAALIRPLSGEDIWAFIERGANWMTPLALYIYQHTKTKNEL